MSNKDKENHNYTHVRTLDQITEILNTYHIKVYDENIYHNKWFSQ